jgi:ribonuclease HI
VTKLPQATNNFAEFRSLEKALIDATMNAHTCILLVTDSQIAFDFTMGMNTVTPPHLKDLCNSIQALIKRVDTIFISKVAAHKRNTFLGNQVADALCTWALNSNREHELIMQLNSLALADRLLAINKTQGPHSASRCDICLKDNDHKCNACPIRKFQQSSSSTTPCPCCLSAGHNIEDCLLYGETQSRPQIAKRPAATPAALNHLLADILDINFDTVEFPRHQTFSQFEDFFETIFSTMLFAKNDHLRQRAAESAITAWSLNYHVEGHSIRRIHRMPSSSAKESRSPHSAPCEDHLTTMARKAAALGTEARAGDVAKVLRSTPTPELNDDIEIQLKRLYPAPSDDEVDFEPLPLENYEINRHRVARYILSRSRRSHPGTLGLSFGILQLYCHRTYKKETRDNPDPRWTVFCELVANIMTGKATHLSPMLHNVFGAHFDKNFEKPGAEPSIRNIGIEETLMRIPAALVFEEALQDAIDRNFLTPFDFGAGKKAGAEIFSKIAEMCSSRGCIITVMDVKKAFNNLRRQDIKAAVAALNNPLLSAFVHFMFERDPLVTFKDRHTGRSLVCELRTGILQGNPLSVFIFALTIAHILRPLREKYSATTIITTFVDDMEFISKEDAADAYPEMLKDFFDTFSRHGLEFDFSDTAKTSVYTIKPVAADICLRLNAMGLKCQNDGIAPCKAPIGTPTFTRAFIEKAIRKLTARFEAFEALWPAMLNRDSSLRRPSFRTYEQFLNLVRLSFLSMSTYSLRTTPPSACEPYVVAATSLSITLIEKVFPSICVLPNTNPAVTHSITDIDMLSISRRIMQLPLSRGGLSLRLPSSISKIAYLASCFDCSSAIHTAAAALSIAGFSMAEFSEFSLCKNWLLHHVPTITEATFYDAAQVCDECNPKTAQQILTTSLNDHEITSISDALKPVPMYFLAFQARTDPKQDHSSWPFNPVIRAAYSIGPLFNSEFSRALQLAILRPTFDHIGWCPACNEPVDLVGLHLLKCKTTHYTDMHNVTKLAVAQRLRSLMSAQMAAVSVHTEKPVNRWCKLAPSVLVEGTERVADIVVLLSGTAQQDIIIADVVSTLCRTPNANDGFYFDLNKAETAKRLTYSKYAIPLHHFFPLAFSRTNVLSRSTMRFCEFVSKYFPKSLKVADRLRATFSRSITAGVASTFNDIVRRLQLAASSLLAYSMVPPVPEPRRLLQSQLARTYAPLNKLPLRSLGAHFSHIISRDSHSSLGDAVWDLNGHS